ncbi:c-type heme family protein [Thalassoroseus pseudoceratinae]|uniref:c-type heme family protein n=1 Tax=Thalassoroseus pseudoceratinae TaxID=2713176 RepID=UPI001F11022D|nr:DUF3365 domain-containing protein [Thalassoroseus pseudoceratinae]
MADDQTRNSGKSDQTKSNDSRLPSSVQEARGRAQLLHETIHGSLQVMHRDFFREDQGLPIPSHSLEDVFKELARSHQVHLRWLAIDARAMDIDHEPRSDFDKAAVKALKSGKEWFETQTEKSYQYVGAIRLSASCLKCHLPARSSNDDRTAGLVIRMSLKQESP